jgi:hypothetical protein
MNVLGEMRNIVSFRQGCKSMKNLHCFRWVLDLVCSESHHGHSTTLGILIPEGHGLIWMG